MKTKSNGSRIIFAATCACALAASAAVPVIDTSSVSVRQDRGRTVVIEYTMNPATAGDIEPAIITVDILTNAVGETAASVGGEHLTTLVGDVNRIVPHTANYRHKILWNPTKEGMGEWTLPAAQVTARLTLWSTNAPPAYWVIDLTQPADRLADRYYPNAEQIPLTVTNILYKTDRLVFRRIPAKGVTWKMGSPEDEEKRNTSGSETQRYVTFSRDYYIAVFETTRGQYQNANSGNTSTKIGSLGSALPSVGYQYNGLRNLNSSSVESVVDWPSNRHERVGSSSHIKKWRDALGGIMVDLPTSAEWEFACRAGTSTAYYYNSTYSGYADYAWTKDKTSEAKEVGLLKPNAWGLYDMCGNVQEWCLDWYTINIPATPVWDPDGPFHDDIDPLSATAPNASSYGLNQRVIRGGSYNNYASNGTHRSACNSRFPMALATDYTGYRLCIVLP